MKKKLTKSRHNIVFSGVLGGIGEFIGIDPTILRVIFIILTFFGIGTPIVLYIILMVIIPADRSGRGPYDTFGSFKGREDSGYNQRNYGSNPYATGSKKRKEAEKVDDDDWSDF